MTIAKTEGIITNNNLGVHGFMFSPDFDTSQSINIGEFLNSIKDKSCKIIKSEIKIENFEIPIYFMGRYPYVEEQSLKNFDLDSITRRLLNKQKDSYDIEKYSNSEYPEKFIPIKLDNGTEYLIKDKNFFICNVLCEGVISIILNPFNVIFEKEELKNKKGYKENCAMYLKKSSSKEYLKQISSRQEEVFEELKVIFDKFYKNSISNGLVCGNFRMFLSNGYAVLSGSKEDSINCLDKDVFPYKANNNELLRKSEEEINKTIEKNIKYKKKSEIVKKRIDKLEELLKEKGYSWTIISKNSIDFKKNENGEEYWVTWMNAQVSDGANYGWFKEQDFIDWINMEGKIPFIRTKLKYFAKKLCENSKDFELIEIKPIDKKVSCYGDYEVVAIMSYKGEKQKYNLDEIKSLLIKFNYKEKKYTINDFEKTLKNPLYLI